LGISAFLLILQLEVITIIMRILPYTASNVEIIQEFINETKKRISNGVTLTFSYKAQTELATLMLNHDISTDDIEDAILSLTPEDYFRGIDPSGQADFDVCVFLACIGTDSVEIYLKYGLEVNGLQILIFSNHAPRFPMNQPFKN